MRLPERKPFKDGEPQGGGLSGRQLLQHQAINWNALVGPASTAVS
jgi:hypothetical protein